MFTKQRIVEYLQQCNVLQHEALWEPYRAELIQRIDTDVEEPMATTIWQNIQLGANRSGPFYFSTLASLGEHLDNYLYVIGDIKYDLLAQLAHHRLETQRLPGSQSFLELQTYTRLADLIRCWFDELTTKEKLNVEFDQTTTTNESLFFYSTSLVISTFSIAAVRETMNRFSEHLPETFFNAEFPYKYAQFIKIKIRLTQTGLSFSIYDSRLVNKRKMVYFSANDQNHIFTLKLNSEGLLVVLGKTRKRLIPASPGNFADLTFRNPTWEKLFSGKANFIPVLENVFHQLYLTQLPADADYLRQESKDESIARVSLKADFSTFGRFTNRRDLFQGISGLPISKTVGRWSSLEIGAMVAILPLISPRDYSLMHQQIHSRGKRWLLNVEPPAHKQVTRHKWGKAILLQYLIETTVWEWPPLLYGEDQLVPDERYVEDYLLMCWSTRTFPCLTIKTPGKLIRLHDTVSEEEQKRLIRKNNGEKLKVNKYYVLTLPKTYELIRTVNRLLEESTIQKNCVHTRVSAINEGKVAIYSYVDPQTTNRYTVEVTYDYDTNRLFLSEIKGLANGLPTEAVVQQIRNDFQQSISERTSTLTK